MFPDFDFGDDSRDEEHNDSVKLLNLEITLKCCAFYQYIVTYPATLLLLFFRITATGN